MAEDRRIDQAYFTSEEIYQISNPSGATPETIYAAEIFPEGDAEPEFQRMIFPDAYEGVKELLDQEGWHELPNHDGLHVASDTGNITVPPADHSAGILPWRSTWIKSGRSGWTLHEDEVRWQDLRDQQRRLPVQEKLATLYQAKIDPVAEKRMRQFPGMRQITLEKLVRRAHEGLGHPDNNRLVRILRQSQAPEEAIQIAKDLKCSVCSSYRLPDAPRRGAPPRKSLAVNDLVGIDTVHLRDHNNKAIPAINVVDWNNTHFQLVIPLAAETAEEVRMAYRQWVRFFGPPRRLMIDLGTEYKSSFRLQCERDGTEVVPSSLEAPHQRGLTERAGGVYSRTFSTRRRRTTTASPNRSGGNLSTLHA